MGYIKESIKQSDILEVQEYYSKRNQRKSKRRLTRLLAKNFEEKDFVKPPLILRLYLRLYKLLRGTSR